MCRSPRTAALCLPFRGDSIQGLHAIQCPSLVLASSVVVGRRLPTLDDRARRVATRLGGVSCANIHIQRPRAVDTHEHGTRWDALVAGRTCGIVAVLRAGPLSLDALYQDLHAHPELAFQEECTAGLLADRLTALGYEVTRHVGHTGIVALLRNGPGPVVMLRTELDACI